MRCRPRSGCARRAARPSTRSSSAGGGRGASTGCPRWRPEPMDTWEIVLYVHLLAMAFFVGGQLVLAAVLVPVERAAPDPERMRAAARRFGVGSAIALVVLLAT